MEEPGQSVPSPAPAAPPSSAGRGSGEPFGSDPGWIRISPSLARARHLECLAAIVAGLLVVLLVALGLASGLALLILLLAWALASWLGWTYLTRRCASWAYLEREQDLLVRRGVMFRHLSVVPYGRMQSVEVTAGPVERSFGLATVRLHTASAATDARIPGLANADANALRDRLAGLGEANAEGL